MENPTPLPPSPNPPTLHNSTNRLNHTTLKNSMENFQQFIFKLTETRPNKPLNSPTQTLLHARLNRFASEYKTPDHLPYSAMIQKVLEELNEKRGSSEESISQYLEERYDNLPWAHSELLKHHLEKLCESGEIVVTRDKRYALPVTLSSSAQCKRKPARRKWRYDFERLRNQQLKKKMLKKRNQKIREDKSGETEILQSCVVENEYSEEAGPSEADIRAAQRHDQQEREESSNVHPLILKLRLRPAKTEVSKDANFVASSNEVQHLQPKCRRLRVVSRQKPVEADVDNLGRWLADIKTKMGRRKPRLGRPPKREVA